MGINKQIRPWLDSNADDTVNFEFRPRLVGSFGQNIAVEFLKKKHYIILKENFYTREGEIDIIAEHEGQIVFIEVKTRLSEKFGLPEDAVNNDKKNKMQQAAMEYWQQKQINNDNYRFDLVAIQIDKLNKRAIIRHHKNITE